MPPRTIIGVAGKMASGKGSVASYLIEHYAANRIRSSDPLREILDILGVPEARHSLHAVSTFVRETFGEDILVKTVLYRIGQLSCDIAVFDGMRRLIDFECFRQLPHFSFWYVDASQEVRFERHRVRNENPGDAIMTLEAFIKKDTAEPEAQIELLKEKADVLLDNNGSSQDLQRQIEEQINIFVKHVV